MLAPLAALCGALVCLMPEPTPKVQVRGDYVEARTADVYTGPCFSNAETFINGDKAVLAWKVTEGSWDGVDLSGLCVAAAVRGTTTFSVDDPAAARAVILVDKAADTKQRAALVALAQHLGGDRLARVAEVKTAVMALTVEDEMAMPTAEEHVVHKMPRAPRALFWAPGLAKVEARPLDERDHKCGNEVVAYPPLSEGVDVQPAYTLGHYFKSNGLNSRWDDPNCRSSFVGHFQY